MGDAQRFQDLDHVLDEVHVRLVTEAEILDRLVEKTEPSFDEIKLFQLIGIHREHLEAYAKMRGWVGKDSTAPPARRDARDLLTRDRKRTADEFPGRVPGVCECTCQKCREAESAKAHCNKYGRGCRTNEMESRRKRAEEKAAAAGEEAAEAETGDAGRAGSP